MEWYWIVYWVGCPVSVVILFVVFGTDSIRKKRELLRLQSNKIRLNSAESEYFGSLFTLLVGPWLCALLWPLGVLFILVFGVVKLVRIGLDAIISLFMREDETEDATK